MFVFSVAAWFPGGATLSQPSNRYARPLAEPGVSQSGQCLYGIVFSFDEGGMDTGEIVSELY